MRVYMMWKLGPGEIAGGEELCMKGHKARAALWDDCGRGGAEITGLSDAENLGAAGVKLQAVAVL